MIPIVEFRDTSKCFVKDGRSTLALEGTNLTISEGEFVSVVGPSGCGKSTLLNLIAGFSSVSSGQVLYRGRPVEAINTRVGYLTQRDNLLPWATIYDNIILGLKIRRMPVIRQKELAEHYLAVTGLSDFSKHYPEELSGGMRKRAALVRMLIYSPEMLLMDEPFSALDAHLKLLMQDELLRIWEQHRTTVLFITHDLEEAITLSDRVVIMSARPGRVKIAMGVNLARPRDPFTLRTTAEFNNIYAALWDALKDDLRRGFHA